MRRSAHAAELRGALWERDSTARQKFSVRGVSFLGPHDATLDDGLRFRECHVVTLIPLQSSLFLRLALYGTVEAVIEVSNAPPIWTSAASRDGVAWVVFPPLGRRGGEMLLPDFIAATASGAPSATRAKLEGLIENGEALPAFHLAAAP